MKIQTALQQGTELLERAGIAAPRLTAEVLLCHALRCERAFLYAHGDDELSTVGWIHFGRYLNERLKGKPTQYIIKRQEFYGREFVVTPDVLIPRPETEHVVETTLEVMRCTGAHNILDVGTGSGAIAISLALESGQPVLASDLSLAALAVASRNRDRHQARVSFFAGDLALAVRQRTLDILVSNPPYVPGADAANMQREVRDWEPHLALFAGETGIEIYRRLIDQAELAVRPGGHIVMELGYQSLPAVRALLQPGWTGIHVVQDLAGWPRVVKAVKAR